jgi:tRNA (guanine37-N1)-methyltransferase
VRRFEGFDERIFDARPVEQLSIGDYILSGGELGAMVLLDACIRLLPGVMGAASSGEEESFEAALLEYPHYTRPLFGKDARSPKCCDRGIMRRSRRGASNARSTTHGYGGRT